MKPVNRCLVATLLLIIAATNSSTAQLLKRVLKRTTEKVEQRVEDKIVEGISNELANRAVRPIDNLYDEMFREQYKAYYGEEYDEADYENAAERMNAMSGMLSAMYGNVELPPSYSFQYQMEVDVYDFGEKKPSQMKLLINTEQEIFGMEQNDKGKQFIVFDFGKDIMTVYNQEDKTAMAIPGVMKFSTQYAAADPELNKKMSDMTIEKMNKTRKILGYSTQGYKSESESEESEFYITEELSFGWQDSFGKMLQKTAPNFYRDTPDQMMKGMMLEAKTKRKEDNKESKWITTKIDNKTFTIDNGFYKLQNLGMEAKN